MNQYFYIDVIIEGEDPVREDEIARFLDIKKAGSCADRDGFRRLSFYCNTINHCQSTIVKLLTRYDLFFSVEFGKVPIKLENN